MFEGFWKVNFRVNRDRKMANDVKLKALQAVFSDL